MAFDLKYMGTKRRLAHIVAAAVSRATPGTFFDVFSGMCAVSDAVGMSRQIWNNDIQIFASKAAAAMFTFTKQPPHFFEIANLHSQPFENNQTSLEGEFETRLEREMLALSNGRLETLAEYLEQ